MPFKKGQSGNPEKQFKTGNTTGKLGGRPKKLPPLDEIIAEVLGEEKEGITAAKAILMALRQKAIKGDTTAADMLLNRGYGKPKEKINLNLNLGADAEETFD